MVRTHSDFIVKFKAGNVDKAAGVIRGAVVAEQDVAAKGHFGWLDKDGVFTMDDKLGVKRIPLFMDAQSLQTALAAAQAEGGRVRVRSDHVDMLGARGGFADNFRMEGNKLLADITLFDAYEDREIVMETAAKTPDLIGLSMDFSFGTEIKDNKAMVRITNLKAVDIVDEGAVTPNGLFRSVRMAVQEPPSDQQPREEVGGTVDTRKKEATAKTSNSTKMADDTQQPDKLDKIITLLTALMQKETDENETAAKAKAKMEADEADKKKAEMAAEEEKKSDEKLAAIAEKLVSARMAAIQKDMIALGIKTGVPVASVDSKEAEAAALAAAEAARNQDPVAKFNALVDAEKKTAKNTTEAIHNAVKKHPEAYRATLTARKIVG